MDFRFRLVGRNEEFPFSKVTRKSLRENLAMLRIKVLRDKTGRCNSRNYLVGGFFAEVEKERERRKGKPIGYLRRRKYVESCLSKKRRKVRRGGKGPTGEWVYFCSEQKSHLFHFAWRWS